MKKSETLGSKIFWWVTYPFRLVLLIVVSPVLLPLLAVAFILDRRQKRKYEIEEKLREKKERERLEMMQRRVIVTEIPTEWNEERCREYLDKVSALRHVVSVRVSNHPIRGRIRGWWCCNLSRRFPKEMRAVLSMLTHLSVKNRFLPTIGHMENIGAELHFDGERMRIASDESVGSLAERALLRYASGQLMLFWHALYDQELMCFSLEQFLTMHDRMSWSGKNIYHRQFDDAKRAKLSSWPWLPRTGTTSDGLPVVEYLTIKPYRPSGILLHRAIFSPSEPFGICDVVIDRIPFRNSLCF